MKADSLPIGDDDSLEMLPAENQPIQAVPIGRNFSQPDLQADSISKAMRASAEFPIKLSSGLEKSSGDLNVQKG